MKPIISVLFCAGGLFAQDISLSGKVSDPAGKALAGVFVRLLASEIADTSAADGAYSLGRPGSSVRPGGPGKADSRPGLHIQMPSSSRAGIHGRDLKGKVTDGIPPAGIYVRPAAARDPRPAPKQAAAEIWLQAFKPGYAPFLQKLGAASGVVNITLTPHTGPDFGPNVLIFDPSLPMASAQSQIDTVFRLLSRAQFGLDRYALLFKPGAYALDVDVGYYTQAAGMGMVPGDVAITGSVRSQSGTGTPPTNVTLQFWRACENLTIIPTTSNRTVPWAVSQAAPMRRVHVQGGLNLSLGGWASGGYLADSRIDNQALSGSQQQWFTRNTRWGGWSGGVWNMFFLGVEAAPAGAWPTQPYTVVPQTPVIREKPFLTVDAAGNYSVRLPSLRRNVQGISWADGPGPGENLPLDQFHVALPGPGNAAALNAALAQGRHLLLTPGIYHLEASLRITRPGTVLLGLGLATLVPDQGTAALEIADVDGVTVSGIVVDAGPKESPVLLQAGEPGSSQDHAANPTVLHDVFLRVGGPRAGSAAATVILNSRNLIADHFWVWRADHGTGVGWDANRGRNGLIVNGADVTAYGLFVEHYQEYQTLWNGEGGRVFFYQCEMPYDPPSQALWQHDNVKGWAGYKVADAVQTHEAWGLGVYSNFRQPVVSDRAVEAPAAAGVKMRHLVAIWLNGADGSGINNVLNATGGAVSKAKTKATVD